MKPTTAHALRLLQDAGPSGVTTADFLQAGVGSRFGGRLHELRHEHGYVITEKRERQGSSRYVLEDAGPGEGAASRARCLPQPALAPTPVAATEVPRIGGRNLTRHSPPPPGDEWAWMRVWSWSLPACKQDGLSREFWVADVPELREAA